ncbi:S-adenosyl-L-methionine-dependent methyltransferase [Mycena alexandri]|uniref:S-adenosyl-L-methionine-dependent methyltransferase n=1 Tax=Mycena alexandri TaxID=1745969 RepID=A0AAD6SSM0_9AGAR|nr:S-adenosyl-L-methionine-dependent methyltransferase [Mycena alexandri]
MPNPGLPTSNDLYGEKAYWDERYTHESADDASYDWLKSYKDVAPLLRALIPAKDARILILGCGNSRLSQDMYDDGYKNIVNTDYSSVVIEQMRRRHEEARPGMQWLEMDVRDLKFEDGSFDIAIDKSTMDALMTAKGDVWDPPQQVVDDCTAEVDEVIRTLKKDSGVFIYLTFGQPHFRRRFLTRPDTKLEIKELGEAFHYYLYILRT